MKKVIRIKNNLGSMFCRFSQMAKPFFTTDITRAKVYEIDGEEQCEELMMSDMAIIYAETGIRCYADNLDHAKKDFS